MQSNMTESEEEAEKEEWGSVGRVEAKEQWMRDLFDIRGDEKMMVWEPNEALNESLELDGAEFKELKGINISKNPRLQLYSLEAANSEKGTLEEEITEGFKRWATFANEDANSMEGKFTLDTTVWETKVAEMVEAAKKKLSMDKLDDYMDESDVTGAQLLVCPKLDVWCGTSKVTKKVHQAVGYMLNIWKKVATIIQHYGSPKLKDKQAIARLQEWMIPGYMNVKEKETTLFLFTLPLLVLRLSMRALLHYPINAAEVYIKSVLNVLEGKLESEIITVVLEKSGRHRSKHLRTEEEGEGECYAI